MPGGPNKPWVGMPSLNNSSYQHSIGPLQSSSSSLSKELASKKFAFIPRQCEASPTAGPQDAGGRLTEDPHVDCASSFLPLFILHTYVQACAHLGEYLLQNKQKRQP